MENNAKSYPLPNVFNSEETSVFAVAPPDDVYGGAHVYMFRPSIGFKDGKTQFDKTLEYQFIQFVEKKDDGTIVPGMLTEQILIMLLDRHKKLNDRFPCAEYEQFKYGIDLALEALIMRVRDRMDRGVMGNLKK
jgi:hypothetical protein